MNNKIKVAVLGYGHLGKWHSQKVDLNKDKVDFVAIVEQSSTGREIAKKHHPHTKVVDDLSKVIHEIDSAIIVTPTSTHFELVKYLLENKKHVFCEKPLCSNDQEAKELQKIALDKNLVIQIGHSERFHEAWDFLREKFQNISSPFTIKINRVAPFKGRATDVDVVQDLAIHDLDLLLYLFKEKPLDIRGTGHKIRTSNYDHADLIIRLENNSQAQIVVSRNATKEVRNLEVVSKDGMISVDLLNGKIWEATSSQFSDGSFVKESSYTKRDHLLMEQNSFYNSILSKSDSVVGLKAGINAVHLVDCSLRAINTHNTVAVKLG